MLEEVLLLLQPLSLLPFDLDLLFEPRQLQRGQEHLRYKEQLRSGRQGPVRSARSTFQLSRGPAEAESQPEWAGPALRREVSWPRTDGAESSGERGGYTSEGEGERGRYITERRSGVGGEDEEQRDRRRHREGNPGRRKHATWWFQLMQSSQVYIDNSVQGSKFTRLERHRMGGGSEGRSHNRPPQRVGVVEGAEAHPENGEEPNRTAANRRARWGSGLQSLTQSEPPKAKSSWMGSPPESIVSEHRRTEEVQGGEPQTTVTHNLRWGRLFGAGNRAERVSR